MPRDATHIVADRPFFPPCANSPLSCHDEHRGSRMRPQPLAWLACETLPPPVAWFTWEMLPPPPRQDPQSEPCESLKE